MGNATMIIERTREAGWSIAATDNTGHLIQRQYYGHNRREAIRLFNREIKQLNKGDNQ
jgi:hypothetical protein